MVKIVLYTTHCPKCKILEKKLNDKNIKYSVCEDVKVMQSLGITSVPVLMIDDKKMNYYDSIQFVNKYNG